MVTIAMFVLLEIIFPSSFQEAFLFSDNHENMKMIYTIVKETGRFRGLVFDSLSFC